MNNPLPLTTGAATGALITFGAMQLGSHILSLSVFGGIPPAFGAPIAGLLAAAAQGALILHRMKQSGQPAGDFSKAMLLGSAITVVGTVVGGLLGGAYAPHPPPPAPVHPAPQIQYQPDGPTI